MAKQLVGDSRTTTIRFGQIDGAGIVFYPRYFQMLERFFEHVDLFSPPRSVKTQFVRPNRLGDEVTLYFDGSAGKNNWNVSGQFAEAEHFRISGSVELSSKNTHGTSGDYFSATSFSLGTWACDASGKLSLSTYYEFLSDAVERWFESIVQVPFRELHFKRRLGIPTVSFATDITRMPEKSEEIEMLVAADHVGTKSMRLNHTLRVGDESLIVTRQTIVFVKFDGPGYSSVSIPADIGNAVRDQQSKTGGH